MQCIEGTMSTGRYIIRAFDAETKQICGIWQYENTLTNINRDLRANMLMGVNTSGYTWDMLAIKYFAFGTGTTPSSSTDTKLVNEQFRKPVTQTVKQDASTVQTIVSLLAEESNFLIREIGVFCGPTATATKDSGRLLSRVNVSIDKNSNLVINVIRQDITTI